MRKGIINILLVLCIYIGVSSGIDLNPYIQTNYPLSENGIIGDGYPTEETWSFGFESNFDFISGFDSKFDDYYKRRSFQFYSVAVKSPYADDSITARKDTGASDEWTYVDRSTYSQSPPAVTKIQFSCSKGYVKILSAIYAQVQNCMKMDVTEKLQKECDFRTKCEPNKTPLELNGADPCAGIDKDFAVTYLCAENTQKRECPKNFAISSIASDPRGTVIYTDYASGDTAYKLSCKELEIPSIFYDDTTHCSWSEWTPYSQSDKETFSINADGKENSVFCGMQTKVERRENQRVFRFKQCKISYQPMALSANSNGDYKLLSGIRIDYEDTPRERILESTVYSKPNWYKMGQGSSTVSNILDSSVGSYSLMRTKKHQLSWTRMCPKNHFLSDITKNNALDTDVYTLQCHAMNNELTFDAASCEWASGYGYSNDYLQSVNVRCPKDGVIKGISSTYSQSRNDRRYRVLCCPVKRGSYQSDGIQIAFQVSSADIAAGSAPANHFNSAGPYTDTTTIADFDYVASANIIGTIVPNRDILITLDVKVGSGFIGGTMEPILLIVEPNADQLYRWAALYIAPRSGLWNYKAYKGKSEWYPIYTENPYWSWTPTAGTTYNFKLECIANQYTVYVDNSVLLSYSSAPDLLIPAHALDIVVYPSFTDVEKSNIDITFPASPGAVPVHVQADLCWNGKQYHGVIDSVTITPNTWYTITDPFSYDSCSNERFIELSAVEARVNHIDITTIKVTEDPVSYVMNAFCQYPIQTTESVTNPCTPGSVQRVTSSAVDEIFFPDDYILSCTESNPCSGDVYPPNYEQEYLITINQCPSSTVSSNVHIGIILRGRDDNLDRKMLVGTSFVDESLGKGRIGTLLHIDFKLDKGEDICIESVKLYDPYSAQTNKWRRFGSAHFGDGVILSKNCYDGDFKLMTGNHYVQCLTKTYQVRPYTKSVYASMEIHCCEGTDTGIDGSQSKTLSMTVTGVNKAGAFESTLPYSLAFEDTGTWAPDASRDYTFVILSEFEKLALVTIGNNDEANRMCIDSVLMNGKDAFLNDYWVGSVPNKENKRVIAAVALWPICKTELTTTIKGKQSLPTKPDVAAISTCVNRNRLVSTECEISQTIETYEETTWETEEGSEQFSEVTMEDATETSHTTTEYTDNALGVGFETGFTGGVDNAVTKLGHVSVSGSYDRSWGEGSEDTRVWSSSLSETKGETKFESRTDGEVNGKSIALECSASVAVPPSQQITYSMMVQNMEIEFETETNIKMTKCSALLRSDGVVQSDDYIYIYNIKGKIKTKRGTNCYVSFDQARPVYPEPITCAEERMLAFREFGDYIPQCQTDSSLYKACQCAYADPRTESICGCVDVTSGNVQNTKRIEMLVGATTPQDIWCTTHCTEGASNPTPPPSPNTVSALKVDALLDIETPKHGDMYVNGLTGNVMFMKALWMLVGTASTFVAIYAFVNIAPFCKTRAKKKVYQFVEDDVDTCIDPEMQL